MAKPWTEQEIKMAIRLEQERGWGPKQIGQYLGRTQSSVQAQLTFRDLDGEKIKTIKNYEGPQVPAHVLADRERRQQLQPRDLTAYLMGDPVR